MTIFVKIKAFAKSKPIIDSIPFIIDDGILTSCDLVKFIVCQMVQDFNNKETNKSLFLYLTDEKIVDGAKSGKVSFGERKSINIQNEKKAVENALLCFHDGVFRLFINDNEIDYDSQIQLNEGDEVSFIRLTMLAGRLL
jgi:hypothetical protein